MQDTSISCNKCGEAQESRAKLFHHLYLKHRAPSGRDGAKTSARVARPPAEPSRGRPYCNICERAFATPHGLTLHTRTSKEHKACLRSREAPAPVSQTISTQPLAPGGCAPEATADDPTSIATENAPAIKTGATVDGGTAANSQHRITSGEAISTNDSTDSIPTGVSKFKYGNNFWSAVAAAQQPDAIQALFKHCHGKESLERYSYRIRPYDHNEISGIRKCKNCGRQQRQILKSGPKTKCIFHPGKLQSPKAKGEEAAYQCCGSNKGGPGCALFTTHIYLDPDQQIVEKWLSYTETPAKPQQHANGTKAREAVALDCEMAEVQGGLDEVVLLSAVDYLTGEVLINSLVQPSKRVVNWRTRWSGVTRGAMATAIFRGEALDGWRGAREELFKHINAETVLIGHALHNDLKDLRILHTRVVDSAILTQKAVGLARQWALKLLCTELLDISIQSNGRRGHDCLEDALATREVALWCISNPQDLERWAVNARKTELEKIEARKKQVEEERMKKEEEKRKEEEKKKEEGRKREEKEKEEWEENEGSGPKGWK